MAHVAENARLVQALFGRQSGQSVQWRFRDVLASLVDAELKLLKVPKAARPLTTRFIVGGAAEVLMDWLDHPQATSADQLAGELAKLALAALEAAKSTRADGQRLHCNATAARSRLMHRAPGSVVCPDVPSMVGAVHPAHVHGSARAVGFAFSLRGELVGAE